MAINGLKHATRRHNLLKGKNTRKREMAEHLKEAIECLNTMPCQDLVRKKGAWSVMERVRKCQKTRLKGKLKYCDNQHYCDICHYIQIKEWAKRIERYRRSQDTEKRSGRLYFYVRDEVFWFPEGIDWNKVETEVLPLFKKRKQRLGSTLFRGMAGFVGMIHRIEICFSPENAPGIRLRSLMIIDRSKVYTDSIDWQPHTYYDANHTARLKSTGMAKNITGIKYQLNRFLPSNLSKGLLTRPEDIAGFCYTFYNRATCVTAGELFKKYK